MGAKTEMRTLTGTLRPGDSINVPGLMLARSPSGRLCLMTASHTIWIDLPTVEFAIRALDLSDIYCRPATGSGTPNSRLEAPTRLRAASGHTPGLEGPSAERTAGDGLPGPAARDGCPLPEQPDGRCGPSEPPVRCPSTLPAVLLGPGGDYARDYTPRVHDYTPSGGRK